VGYEVEFITITGETIAIVSLFSSQVRGIGDREIAQAQVLTKKVQESESPVNLLRG